MLIVLMGNSGGRAKKVLMNACLSLGVIFVIFFGFHIRTADAAGYQYYIPITVTSNTSIASGTETNFPMLVSSTLSQWEYPSGHISNLVTAPNGGQEPADLVFATSTANCGVNNLNFETESYSSSTGALVDWVNVPSLSAGSVIYACYGNSAITTDQSHPSSTWNNNYAGVWHLANPTSSVSTYDSVSGAVGTNNGQVGTTIGEIDGAGIWGTHTTDAIVTDISSNSTQRTYSLWTYRTGLGGSSLGRMFEKRTSGAQTDVLLYDTTCSSYGYDRTWTSGIVEWCVSLPTANVWHYIVITYDSSSGSNSPIIYVDGVSQSIRSTSGFPASGSPVNNTDNYVIGNRTNDNARNWAGSLDEFTIANTILSPSWILTEYNNQNSPSTFYTIGSETAFATVPDAPTGLTATSGNAQVALSWTAPSNGGATITYYNIYRSTSSGGEGSTPVASSTTTSYTNTGLTNGTTYYYDIAAVNSVGVGATSSQVSATPATVPRAPTIGIALPGNVSALVQFTAPSSNGGSTTTFYTAASNPGNHTATSTVSPITVSGLTNGTSYTFTVAAMNAVGQGASSTASNAVVPAVTCPSVISGLETISSSCIFAGTVDGVDGGITVNNGATLTISAGQTVVFDIGSSTIIHGSIVIIGNGQLEKSYLWTVDANHNGYPATLAVYAATSSPGSNYERLSYEVSRTVADCNDNAVSSYGTNICGAAPAPPTIGTATAGVGSASVAFTPDGATTPPITGYTATSNPGGKTGTGSGSPITVSGLTGGQSYTFTVTATNASGTSPSSGASNAVTPTGLPGAPTGLSGTPSSGQVALSWTAPSNGGANITSYKIYQGTSSGGETLLLSTGNSNTTYTSTGLTNGTTYYYEVSAVNSVGEGSKSSEANATPGGVPGAPTGGNAYSETGHAQIYWTAPSNNGSPISSFSIYRSTTSGGETYIGSNGVTSYNDTSSGVTNTYYYEVAATNAFGQGPLSAEFSSTCQYGYWDGDGDGYGAGPAVAVCAAGTAMPGGYVSNDTDCYDSNANANPADTAFWGVNRGDGSFDYNCDGLQTSDAPSYVSTCTAEPDTVCTAYGLSGTTGACQEVSEYSTGALCTGNRQTGSFCRVVAQPGGYTGWQGSVPACGATGYMYGEEGTGLGSNGGYSWYCTGSECIGFYACDINFQEQNLCQ